MGNRTGPTGMFPQHLASFGRNGPKRLSTVVDADSVSAFTNPYVLVGLYGYTVSLLCSALDAYSIFSIPISWLGQLISVFCAAWVFLNSGALHVPGLKWWMLFLCWGSTITIVRCFVADFHHRMPPLATTGYESFLCLRFVHLTSFGAQIYLCYWLLAHGKLYPVIRHTTIVGSLAAAFAMYVYLAHRYGLSEPPRSRLGTSGDAQAVSFTFAFHRALGSFREPGAMASWITIPFCLSFLMQRRIVNAHSVLMGSALLLSGSLSALGGGLLGIITGFVIVQPSGARGLRNWAKVAFVPAASVAVFTCVAIANDFGTTNLFKVMMDRVHPILDDGFNGTNRGYLQEYYRAVPVTVTGVGFGHANILLAEFFGSPLMGSFLSLYRNVLYSTGWVGLILLAIFFVIPLWRVWIMRTRCEINDRFDLFLLCTGYATWLFMFGSRSEEPPMAFAICYAFLAFATSRPIEFRMRKSTWGRRNLRKSILRVLRQRKFLMKSQ